MIGQPRATSVRADESDLANAANIPCTSTPVSAGSRLQVAYLNAGSPVAAIVTRLRPAAYGRLPGALDLSGLNGGIKRLQGTAFR